MTERPVLRVAVFASGSGSNFQALLDHFHDREEVAPADAVRSGARVVLLVACREGTGAAERARRAGVQVAVLPEAVRADGVDAEARFILERLREVEAELVVLAGWLRLVPSLVVRAFRSRMLNIHPALLPAFGGKGMYGRHVHRAVLESGTRVSGPTVHLVDEEYDRGPIVAQWPVPVLEDDDEDRLAARVLEAEHRLLPAVVEAMAEEWPVGAPGRRLPLPWLRGERFLLQGSSSGVAWLPGRHAAIRPGKGAQQAPLARTEELLDGREGA